MASSRIVRAILFPAPSPRQVIAATGMRVVDVVYGDGDKTLCLYAPAPAGSPTLVHFHGNGEQLADMCLLAKAFSRAGLGFYGVEYPGYGKASGHATERALYQAAEAALVYLDERLGVERDDVVLQGQSLGSGVAVEMAVRNRGAKLVLLSPFTSTQSAARRIAPSFIVRWIVHDLFDNAAKAPQLELPVFIVHGQEDSMLPVAMGQELAKLFPNATLLELPDTDHNDLWSRGGTQLVGRIASFACGKR